LILRFFLLWWEALLNGDELPEFQGRYGESIRELEDAIERNGLLGPLDTSYLIPMEVTHLRQLLLRELPFNSQFPDLFAEQNQCPGHAV